jgi:di/tricarboxylate transporter
MSPALLSVLALLVAIALSMTTRLNVGLAAIVFAWLVGVYSAGLSAEAVMRGFPASLFLTLTGLTLLFAAAEVNGTLERLARGAVGWTRGRARLIPLMFFAIPCLVSAIGPGAISSVALVVPLAMVIGLSAGVPPFLTSLMVANGANAGNLSPISAVGVIANSRMAGVGLGGHEWKVMLANLAASALVALAAYFILGGHRLSGAATDTAAVAGSARLSRQQRLTTGVLAAWIVGVLALRLNPGLSAFVGAVVLFVAGAAEEGASIRRVPWGVILMVCGVSTLIAVLEATGGMELFTALLAALATPGSLNGVIAFVTGAISSWSSTSGVVLPAFLPTVPGLVANVGGGDPLAVALSINVGSSLVDVSPLSTLGALCLAATADGPTAKILFRQLLIWGLSMTVVGALLCQTFADMVARL